MTPEERQLISGLFDRMKPAANQQRDREAEAYIADAVRSQPYAPYLLSQTVIVQDQALRAANDKIQRLEAQVRQQQAPQQEDTSFLGGLGRSIFGSDQPDQGQSRPTVPTTGGHGPAPLPQEPGPFRGQGNPSGGPWGQAASGAAGMAGSPMGGGGFLKGALGAAAGVAGGVLLADGLRGLFHGGNNPFGIASGFGGGLGGGMGGYGAPGGETVVNNYYDNPNQGADSLDYGDAPQDAGDFGGDSVDPGSYGGYSTDV